MFKTIRNSSLGWVCPTCAQLVVLSTCYTYHYSSFSSRFRFFHVSGCMDGMLSLPYVLLGTTQANLMSTYVYVSKSGNCWKVCVSICRYVSISIRKLNDSLERTGIKTVKTKSFAGVFIDSLSKLHQNQK